MNRSNPRNRFNVTRSRGLGLTLGLAAALTLTSSASAGWLVGGGTGPSGVNRGIWDYTQGSSTLSNFRFTTTQNWSIAGIENVNGTTYVLTTFFDNRLNIASFSGNVMSLNPVTGPLGASAEGDLGYNPADGHFYALENTPFTSTKKIWRIDPSGWSASVAGAFQADDPSGIAFDNAGNAVVLDTHGNTGGIAELIRFDVMSSPGAASFVSNASLGYSTGPTCGLDFDPTVNQLYVMSMSGAFAQINGYLGPTPSAQVLDYASGASYVTGLAWVPEPASLLLVALGGVAALRRWRG